MTGSGPSWSIHAAGRVSRGWSRSYACAVAAPYRSVLVKVARELTGTTIEALAVTGWALEEPLSYMVNGDALYDCQSTTRDHTQDVLAVLDAPEHANHHVAVCIYHGEARTGGQLLFFPGRMTCSFIPTINRRRLPDSADFTDLSWYLHTLVPPLLTVGLKSYKACDIGH